MFHSLLFSLQLFASADSLILKDSLREDIVIQSVRASDQTPVSQTNLSKTEIERTHQGSDLPYILHNTPSIISQSDAGNGFGYSYFRMRGIDYTRISLNVNGIPINDPENQGFFSNNFADLASSASNIQIQRGVGTTANGTAPIAGSVNITTQNVQDPKFTKFTLGYGSYDTRRITLEHNTGIDPNSKFGVYGRFSLLSSNGFKASSGSEMKTFLFGGGYFGKKSTLKFNIFGGATESNLAFYAVPKSILETDYRSNINSQREKDAFQQFFYQVSYNFNVNKNVDFSAMGYLIQGSAPRFLSEWYNDFPYPISYSTFNLPDPNPTKTSSNFLINYQLNQLTRGGMFTSNYKNANFKAILGVHANTFSAEHKGSVQDTDLFPVGYKSGHVAYQNTGIKNEMSTFLKCNYTFFYKLFVFGDAQLRYTTFGYNAVDKPILRDNYKVDNLNWTFFNPKIGIRYNLTNKFSTYSSFGITSKEPTRLDIFGGNDKAVQNIKKDSIIKPEKVYNTELGIEYKSKNLSLALNGYWMEFRNEIAATGGINNFGYFYRQNVPESNRKGIELNVQTRILNKIILTNSTSISQNRIKEFTQTIAVKDVTTQFDVDAKTEVYKNVNPVLTPSFTLYQSIRYEPFSFLSAEICGRYVSKMYLDNTNNETLTTPDYLVVDAKMELNLSKLTKVDTYIRFSMNNVLNTKYFTSGTPTNNYQRDVSSIDTRFVEPNYYVGALRNIMVTAGVKF
ncbi:MAG: TonB-dependent receptor [Bacteroidetes bacterium]|nr:MAG: TonB-dependent receptor [Bacteroidota bacterium]